MTVYSPTWTTPATPTTDAPLFAGYFYDAETSLYQVRHRYYHAELGGFVSRDPIGYAAGDGNLYRYCGNAPLTHIDPEGTDEWYWPWESRAEWWFGIDNPFSGKPNYNLLRQMAIAERTVNHNIALPPPRNDPKEAFDSLQTSLDVAGLFPGVGIVPDALNTGISGLRGNFFDAAMNGLAMVPLLGQCTKGGQLTVKAGRQALKHSDEAADAAKCASKVVTELKRVPSTSIPRPHDHHILFKKGIGKTQQELVQEGQVILRKYGIDPIKGSENLIKAPNIKGQHTLGNVEEVLQRLKDADAAGATKEDIVDVLREMGEKAARRR